MKKIKKSAKITILSLSWRDITSPNAGGAEVHTHEMLRRADKSKYRIYHLSTRKKGQPEREVIDGVMYLRHGNALTVILAAMRFYMVNRHQIDFVIDQCNTHRFLPHFGLHQKRESFIFISLPKKFGIIAQNFRLVRSENYWRKAFCV